MVTTMHWSRWFVVLILAGIMTAQQPGAHKGVRVHDDGSDWHMQGDGVVACPCATPCPCRTNAKPSFGHCEATLYMKIHHGHYGKQSLDGLRVVQTSGSCAMTYRSLAALYFDAATPETQRIAFMKLLASFFPDGAASFPYVRTVSIRSRRERGLFDIQIPDILEMKVDVNWGRSTPPFPEVAASDSFSNVLRYGENLRYRLHDPAAGLDFDYSRRQANYRSFDLDANQYRRRQMLAQFLDDSGWFNAEQLHLIQQQHLVLPDVPALRRKALSLRQQRGSSR
jgi:hypothetical protein